MMSPEVVVPILVSVLATIVVYCLVSRVQNKKAQLGFNSSEVQEAKRKREKMRSSKHIKATNTDIWKACKKEIVCDAEGCKNQNPASRCGRCQMVYYCSPNCQKTHWQIHRPDCIPIDDMRLKSAGMGKDENIDGIMQMEPNEDIIRRVLREEGLQCGICLQDKEAMTNPIVLRGCHHTFCFLCLKQWNDIQTKTMLDIDFTHPPKKNKRIPTCPICRQSIPDVTETTWAKARHLVEKAYSKLQADPTESRDLCNQALSVLKKFEDDESTLSISPKENFQILLMKGEALTLKEDYDEAITSFLDAAAILKPMLAHHREIEAKMSKIALLKNDPSQEDACEILLDNVQEMLKRDSNHTRPETYAYVMLKLGKVQRLAHKWTDAKKTYQELGAECMENQDDTTPQQQREVFASTSECAYHLGRYDIAKNVGEGALLMNRYYPWAHKYVALAKKAEGDVEGAKKVAAEAVIYEAPWDDEHQLKVQDWFQVEFL